jgi:hypothetical protein
MTLPRFGARPDERLPYSAIIDRPPLRLPAGVRMIVWPVVNVEEWNVDKPMPRRLSPPPGGGEPVPDIATWTWHEYGMRVGIWRIFEVMHKLRIKPTLSLNAKVCETRPRIAAEALRAGWEFMAHCYEQGAIQKIADQRAMIAQTLDVLTRFTGIQPTGWLGPGRGQTHETLDHLAEAGFKWFGDWVLDDQPVEVQTAHGPILSIPYSTELNDIGIMLTSHQRSGEMYERIKDAFDQMHAETAAGSARILAFGVHPYISGVAHRIKYFARMLQYMQDQPGTVFWTGDQIHDWFRGQ